MTSIAAALALLNAIIQLLTFIAANPSIPAEARTNAIKLAERSILLAQDTIQQHQSLLPRPVPQETRIVPKPNYDLYSLERTIHALINEERKRLDLKPLELREEISRVARAHSEDQANTNRRTTSLQKPCSYPMIRHEGLLPNRFSLAERLDAGDIQYRRAGENIAMLSTAKDFVYSAPSAIICPNAPRREIPKDATPTEARSIILYNIETAEIALEKVPDVKWINQDWLDLETIARRAVSGWLESPGHYANITNENFTRTGIGAVEINRYIIITQIFVEPR
jgi:uncharacterized protein YkwD